MLFRSVFFGFEIRSKLKSTVQNGSDLVIVKDSLIRYWRGCEFQAGADPYRLRGRQVPTPGFDFYF